MRTVKALIKARRSWYLYDWANQAFALSVLAIFIPNYITTLFDTATGGGKEILGFTISGSGFFSFIMKAVAVVGPLIFFIISSMLDNRSALLSIVFVIFIGTFLCALVDMEKGKKEASVANKVR